MTDDILFPPGRLVQGDLYNPKTTDMDGNQLVFKSGPNKGEPRSEYFFAVAIPKQGESDFRQTKWGAMIAAEAAKGFNAGEDQRRDFAWKIVDGDSQEPNQRNKRPCDQEGFPGHWIVRFVSSYQPQIVNHKGEREDHLLQKGAISPGYYIQVYAGVNSNKDSRKPGVYINPKAVAFCAYGPVIDTSGMDTKSIGFGQQPLPSGAMQQPPEAQGLQQAAPAPAAPAPVAPAPVAPAPVAPAPVAPAPPPPAPEVLQTGKRMTEKAAGLTYEQFITNGWTDEQLIQAGLMEA